MFKCLHAVLLGIGALWSAFAYSAEIPPAIKAFLLERRRTEIIANYEAIPVLDPREYTRRFIDDRKIEAIGAGFNGIAFQNHRRRVSKFNFRILAADDIVELTTRVRQSSASEKETLRKGWASFLKNPELLQVDIHKLRGREKEPLGSQPISEELLGMLLWSVYNPEFNSFPSMISNDGLAFESDLIEGETLLDILRSEREGTPFHKNYNLEKIWKKVAYWQYLAEIMLLDSGVTIDLFTPGNFIVSGSYDNPEVQIVDNAIAKPSPEAYEVYEKRGWTIPKPTFEDELRLIVWPTMPEHIVSSKLWDMNFKQAIDFIRARYQLDSDADAIARLAEIPEWKIIEAPMLENYSNVRKAQALVCEQALQKINK